MLFYPCLVVIWTSFLLSRTHAFTSADSVLHKCCPQDHRFKFNKDHVLECLSLSQDTYNISGIIYEDQMSEDKEKELDYWWWIPKHLLRFPVNSTDIDEYYYFDNQNASLGSKPKCKRNSMDILHDNGKTSEFRLLFENNETLLEVVKEVSGTRPRQTYPSGTFCVDSAAPRMFVAVLCPCGGGTSCVRKCCAEGQMYHVADSECQDAAAGSGGQDWLPSFADDAGMGSFYRLTNQMPDCVLRVTHKVMSGDNNSKFLLFKDGSIQANVDADADPLRIPVDEYCSDSSVATGETLVVACYRAELFGVIFLTVALLLLIVSVLVLIASHACYCKQVMTRGPSYGRKANIISVKI